MTVNTEEYGTVKKSRRRNPRAKGQRISAYARRIIEDLYPGAAVHEAKPTVRWTAARRPINVEEDLWSVADHAVLHRGDLILIQVTSEAGESARRTRLRKWATEHAQNVPACATIEIWAWKDRGPMLRTRWCPVRASWERMEPLNVPPKAG